jgi:hypothetical protein
MHDVIHTRGSLKINSKLITNQIVVKCGNYAVNLWIHYS